MKRLKRLESIVRAELTENEAARKSDTALLMGCFERMGIDTSRSFAELAADGSLRQMESITRARRKVQADSPELKDGTVMELRAAREEEQMASEKGFGTPSEIIIDGRRMSREEFETHIAESGVPQVDVKRFALTRINGVVKLYIATV